MRERRDAWAQRKRGGGVESVADTVFVMGMDMYLTEVCVGMHNMILVSGVTDVITDVSTLRD